MTASKVPATIFIPSMKLMWDIMRSCVGVKYSADLWFHQVDKWEPEAKSEGQE
jgi:hypothetical protein